MRQNKDYEEKSSQDKIHKDIIKKETVKSSDVKDTKEKFVIDIEEDEYNTYDFEDEYFEYQEKEQKPNKKSKKTKTRRVVGVFVKIIVTLMIVAILGITAIAGVYAYGDYAGIVGNGIKVKVSIPPNTYVSQVGNILKENGIIKYPEIFNLYTKYFHKEEIKLHYGTFSLDSNMGYKQLIKILQNPANSESGIKVTIKEGQNVLDIAKTLEENHVCTQQDFLNEVANGEFNFEFIAGIQNPQDRMYRLEGYLFPDTYTFKQDTPAKEVINTMLTNFEKKFTPQMKYAIKISGFTFDQMITLASIVQAEAPTKPDMMKVSSVYRNRLANPKEYKKLQADPTSKYANRVIAKEGATKEMVDAYDTYKSEGLPPGAINNPGLEAILSAIYPATTDYYYFCSDLSTGQFYYANTYDQHKKNLTLAGLSETPAQ